MSDDDFDLDVDDRETTSAGGDGNDGHPCPECGEQFDSAVKLGLHRKREHGVEGVNARKRRRGRDAAPRDRETARPNPASRSRRGRLVSETLVELANLIERRGDNVDDLTFAAILRRDADRIGGWLAALAERRMFAGLGPIVDNLFGDGGPLSAITALGPTVRKLVASRPRRQPGDGEFDRLAAEYERIVAADGEDAALRWAALNGLEVQNAA